MPGKIKTITLAHGFRPDGLPVGTYGYRVEKITDSLDYAPGQILTKQEADSLCHSRDWKVIVIPAPKP